jgi:hypothetical protein
MAVRLARSETNRAAFNFLPVLLRVNDRLFSPGLPGLAAISRSKVMAGSRL